MRKLHLASVATLAVTACLGFVLGLLYDGGFPDTALAGPPGAPPASLVASPSPLPDDGKLRIVIIGAHPDDAEYRGAGVAKMWADRGHHVKLVSVTNGDIGHTKMAGGQLARRRTAEVMEVGRRLGTTTQVLDIHDGELMPTLENRRTITRLIREWNADLVITNRPNDYHPDHRYTSILVQDSAFMVAVPFFCPDVPYLTKNPVFLYTPDRFTKPNPFQADIAVAIDDVMEETADALMVMESQIFEGGATGYRSKIPTDEAGRTRRHNMLRDGLMRRYSRQADMFRDTLVDFYGEEQGKKIRHAQAFEICEYGARPTREDLKRLFPFFSDR